VTKNHFIKTITPILNEYRLPRNSENQCADVCEAIRITAEQAGVKARICYVSVGLIGHNVLTFGDEVVDFTLSQFVIMEDFPYRCKIGSKKFKKVYSGLVYSDNHWDWRSGSSKLIDKLKKSLKGD
jgi:hypothetical protein